MAQEKIDKVLKALEEVFAPTETKKAKGEPKYIIVVNGSVITNRIKGKKDLEKTLRGIALEDARNSSDTKVLVYKLEGEADVEFEASVTVGKKNEEEEA